MRLGALPVALALALVLLAACGTPSGAGGNSHKLQVIAAENFWGSIAGQLGGTRVSVTSIVTNPNTDPHEYESSARDARAFASADVVILNGAGYDDWGQKLLAANPNPGRTQLVVAHLLGKKAGDNPHFWYSPTAVRQVVDRISADFKALDAGDSAAFDHYHADVLAALRPYDSLVAQIKAAHAGAPVASTESVFVYLATALGLDLVSPAAFMNALAEGDDPPAQTVAQFQNELHGHQVKLLVYNTQTSTPITDNLKQIASANGIPIVGVSETLQPASASFQAWQVKQLEALQAALAGQ